MQGERAIVEMLSISYLHVASRVEIKLDTVVAWYPSGADVSPAPS